MSIKYRTPEQVAEDFPAFNAEWWRQQCRSGRVRASRVGGRWLIPEGAPEELIERMTNQTARTRPRRRRAS